MGLLFVGRRTTAGGSTADKKPPPSLARALCAANRVFTSRSAKMFHVEQKTQTTSNGWLPGPENEMEFK
jgi:hypothetical protein